MMMNPVNIVKLKMKCEDEAIYSADGKKILLKEEAIIRRIGEIMQPVIDVVIEAGKVAYNLAQSLANSLIKISQNMINKKITKKRFMKLLQAGGIQRNEINKIVENSNGKYTYARLYNIIEDYNKKQQK